MARSPGPALTPCRQVITTEDVMVERRDMDFEVEGGDHLRGWLFQPDTTTSAAWFAKRA
jgi:hypothetical protein